MKHFFALLAACALILMAGCGSDGEYKIGVIRHMNVPVHGGLDARVTRLLLQQLRPHTAFYRYRRVGVSQRVHTEMLDARFITQLVKVGIL